MNQLDHDNCIKIVIPISDSQELHQYQRSLINLLSKIDINDCNSDVKEDVKSLYKLLSHLMNDKTSILDNPKFLTDFQN